MSPAVEAVLYSSRSNSVIVRRGLFYARANVAFARVCKCRLSDAECIIRVTRFRLNSAREWVYFALVMGPNIRINLRLRRR